MEIKSLTINNIEDLTCRIPEDVSIGIGGLSGSGKSSFCSALSDEAMKRVATLLPKSDYRFLFGDTLTSNYSAQNISGLLFVFYLGKSGTAFNPRSTVGTHTGIFKEIRETYAKKYHKASEFFSFNNSIMWCDKCKGRGSTAGNLCQICKGSRYAPGIKEYTIELDGNICDITDINEKSAEELIHYTVPLGITEAKKNILQNMIDLEIGYLSLNRIMSTLSGGENVRLLLAEFMAQCVHSLVIIDEISIGLDRDTLIHVMEKVSKLGQDNQVWLIDHSDIILKSTDINLYFGPGSGKEGGKIVKESPRPAPFLRTIHSEEPAEYYVFENMQKRNLDLQEVLIPKNKITTITGQSGCGKSTLVNECIIPYMGKKYKTVHCELIGQDRNQSITSKSTVATFLDIKKRLDKFDPNILTGDLSQIQSQLKKDKNVTEKTDLLIKLGLGYLTFDTKVQTLSTGEFQCLHLVSKMTENRDNELLLIFDEPSKGLSQNILNLLMQMFDEILQDSQNTILIIEHNPYILKCSDFILDFGKRKSDQVTKLPLIKSEDWHKNTEEKKYSVRLFSKPDLTVLTGEETITENIDEIFAQYENKWKGGLLKNLSPTARWIYGDFHSNLVEPVVVMDLEKDLYSRNTFLYEISGLINRLIGAGKTSNLPDFDFYSKSNLCECCRGTGNVKSFDFSVVMKDPSRGLWDGLFHDDVMKELKRYNYSKIKFLLKEVKKETGFDLERNYDQMTEEEKNTFLYGYWKNSFYDKDKKTQRKWQGMVHLITKYMKSSKSSLKDQITDSKKEIICPICKGTILGHDKKLWLEDKLDIRDIIVSSIKDIPQSLSGDLVLRELSDIVGKDTELNFDVSKLPKEVQVRLKVNEIKNSNFLGFTIVLKNTAPFSDLIQEDIKQIGKSNKVFLLDYPGICDTKENILQKYFLKGKIKSTSYVYEVLGYKKISTQVNQIRKAEPCKYCGGKRVLREESIFEGVDVTETPCHACRETGISDLGLGLEIEGISVKDWLFGTLKNINDKVSDEISDICPMKKISELNKQEMISIHRYMEG